VTDGSQQLHDAEALFRENLPLIERVVLRVCRHEGLRDADADDFTSTVHLALIERDYAVLRAWERRSSLATYLTVVVKRLLADQRNHTRGRWTPSASARRGGPAAILLETLVRRDGRTVEEALPLVRRIEPSIAKADAEAMLARLPRRAPPLRLIALEDAEVSALRAVDEAQTAVEDRELARVSMDASRVVQSALASLPTEDRAIVRLHFGSAISLADIARMLRLPQRPLYRRLIHLLKHLRGALAAAGIDAQAAESLIGSAVQALDFGLTDGKSDAPPQSPSTGELRSEAEADLAD
jgi:RNA polymerase sigma factor (sigma-70 family)